MSTKTTKTAAVKRIHHRKDWQPPGGGSLRSYYDIETSEGVFDFGCVGQPPFVEGEVITFEVDASSAKGNPVMYYTPPAQKDTQRLSIERQVALKCAVETEVAASQRPGFGPISDESVLETADKYFAWLQR